MRFFTPEDDAKLTKLWFSRIGDDELAFRMGRHRSVVRRRAEKIGLPSSRRVIWNRDTEASEEVA
jgi:hypothetical protein